MPGCRNPVPATGQAPFPQPGNPGVTSRPRAILRAALLTAQILTGERGIKLKAQETRGWVRRTAQTPTTSLRKPPAEDTPGLLGDPSNRA